MKRKTSLFLILGMVSGLMLTACQSSTVEGADEYPSQDVNLIVPYSPGGATDLTARPLAEELTEVMGANVVVLNQAGASGSVAAAELLNEEPDGYNLLLASAANMTIVPYSTGLDYTYTDFTPIAQITHTPIALAVNSSSDIKTYEDFLEAAKTASSPLRYSSAGANSTDQIAMDILSEKEGITVTHMPFDGGSAAVAALLGDHVELTAGSLPDLVSQYQAGTINIIAVFADERQDVIPDVPCMKELGRDDMAYGSWIAVVGPKDMPEDIVKELSDAIKTAMDDPELQDIWEKMNVYASYLDSEALAEKMAIVDVEFGDVVKNSN